MNKNWNFLIGVLSLLGNNIVISMLVAVGSGWIYWVILILDITIIANMINMFIRYGYKKAEEKYKPMLNGHLFEFAPESTQSKDAYIIESENESN